jgi:hypothetical protein
LAYDWAWSDGWICTATRVRLRVEFIDPAALEAVASKSQLFGLAKSAYTVVTKSNVGMPEIEKITELLGLIDQASANERIAENDNLLCSTVVVVAKAILVDFDEVPVVDGACFLKVDISRHFRIPIISVWHIATVLGGAKDLLWLLLHLEGRHKTQEGLHSAKRDNNARPCQHGSL